MTNPYVPSAPRRGSLLLSRGLPPSSSSSSSSSTQLPLLSNANSLVAQTHSSLPLQKNSNSLGTSVKTSSGALPAPTLGNTAPTTPATALGTHPHSSRHYASSSSSSSLVFSAPSHVPPHAANNPAASASASTATNSGNSGVYGLKTSSNKNSSFLSKNPTHHHHHLHLHGSLHQSQHGLVGGPAAPAAVPPAGAYHQPPPHPLLPSSSLSLSSASLPFFVLSPFKLKIQQVPCQVFSYPSLRKAEVFLENENTSDGGGEEQEEEDDAEQLEKELLFCPVCSLPMVERFRTLPCYHVVCGPCADERLQQTPYTCPVCEAPVSELRSLHPKDRLYICSRWSRDPLPSLKTPDETPQTPLKENLDRRRRRSVVGCKKVFLSKKSLRYHRLVDHELNTPTIDFFLSSLEEDSSSSSSLGKQDGDDAADQEAKLGRSSMKTGAVEETCLQKDLLKDQEEEERNREILQLFSCGDFRYLSKVDGDSSSSSLSPPFSLASILSRAKQRQRGQSPSSSPYGAEEERRRTLSLSSAGMAFSSFSSAGGSREVCRGAGGGDQEEEEEDERKRRRVVDLENPRSKGESGHSLGHPPAHLLHLHRAQTSALHAPSADGGSRREEAEEREKIQEKRTAVMRTPGSQFSSSSSSSASLGLSSGSTAGPASRPFASSSMVEEEDEENLDDLM